MTSRVPVIVLSLGGLAVATVLTLFQVGVLDAFSWTPLHALPGSGTISLLIVVLVAPEVRATVRRVRTG